jgi:hypothetical protein
MLKFRRIMLLVKQRADYRNVQNTRQVRLHRKLWCSVKLAMAQVPSDLSLEELKFVDRHERLHAALNPRG